TYAPRIRLLHASSRYHSNVRLRRFARRRCRSKRARSSRWSWCSSRASATATSTMGSKRLSLVVRAFIDSQLLHAGTTHDSRLAFVPLVRLETQDVGQRFRDVGFPLHFRVHQSPTSPRFCFRSYGTPALRCCQHPI